MCGSTFTCACLVCTHMREHAMSVHACACMHTSVAHWELQGERGHLQWDGWCVMIGESEFGTVTVSVWMFNSPFGVQLCHCLVTLYKIINAFFSHATRWVIFERLCYTNTGGHSERRGVSVTELFCLDF